MQRLIMKFMTFIILAAFIGCVPKAPSQITTDPEPEIEEDPHANLPKTTIITENLASSYSTRNFEQMIQTYSRATGIHPSIYNIKSEIIKIKAQLPLYNDPLSYNNFNQIALTALALRFCEAYVSATATSTAPTTITIFGLTYTNLNYNSIMSEKIAEELIKRLAQTDEVDDPFLTLAKTEMTAVMKIAPATVGGLGSSLIDAPTPAKRIMVGCGLFLASSYFTMD